MYAALNVAICGNFSTYDIAEIRRAIPRFRLRFTPTYSSWLNLVERWFVELTASGASVARIGR
jgi:transposase